MFDDERDETPQADAEAAEQPSGAPEPQAEASEQQADAPDPAPEPEASEQRPRSEAPRQRRERKPKESADQPEVIPGAHLEPDLVLEEASADDEADVYGAADLEQADGAEAGEAQAPAEVQAPLPTPVLDLAADARYRATGKRKSAVARVTLKPGTGVYTVNGRELDVFFPRPTLQRTARRPLETVGHQERMDVVVHVQGGGVSAQAGAVRHGIARALVEADPNLRGELKRRGFLTRDPRVKERKKAGLKKARKRPQFSKR